MRTLYIDPLSPTATSTTDVSWSATAGVVITMAGGWDMPSLDDWRPAVPAPVFVARNHARGSKPRTGRHGFAQMARLPNYRGSRVR